MSRRFDAIVIGTGQAGPSMAGRLTDAGLRVAVVERGLIGGTCVNTGCKPTKTLVASAYAAHLARRAADYGVVTGEVRIDMGVVHARSQKISKDSRDSNEAWLLGMKTCTLLRGQARFVGPHAVAVGDEILEADRIFINVGARAAIPDLPGLVDTPHFNNSSLLATAVLPEHLIIVGGSYIGLEFAQIYRRFGSKVTVIERSARLIAREDPEISEAIRAFLEAEGIVVHTDAKNLRFARRDSGVSVSLGEGVPDVLGSHLLVAIGRRPNTEDLGLDKAGVATDARGYIVVNDRLETSVPHIWALGDCNGRGAFTHTAYNDFEIVAANLLDGADRKVSDRIPCYALYVDPPLGRVGMTETEARASGRRVLVGRRPMTRVGRAVEKDETLGLMKIVVDADSRAILGAAILGVGGDEAIHAVLDMMAAGGNADTLTRTMHIHPTVAELIPTIAGEIRD